MKRIGKKKETEGLLDLPWRSLRSRRMEGTYTSFLVSLFSPLYLDLHPHHITPRHIPHHKTTGSDGSRGQPQKAVRRRREDSGYIPENEGSHSPSNFTDNMPTLNPLKTVIEHDIVSRVVIAFCEEQLGRISICFLEAGVRCVS